MGAIVGVGIFFNPSKVAALTGSGGLALAAWGVAGFIALCGALTFAELGARYHASGAQYEVLRDAFGPFPAFLYVFCNATAIQAAAIGVIAKVCADHVLTAVGRNPAEMSTVFVNGMACTLIAALVAANIVGVRWGARVQTITVFAKIIVLLAIAALAAFAPASVHAATTQIPRSLSAPAAVMAALVPAFFAYGGWQQALWISGEVKEPRRNLPRAILIGVGIVIVVYLLANWAYISLLGVDRVATSKVLAADAVGGVLGEGGRRFIAAAVAVSAFGVLNSQLLAGPRLVFGMARDGRFFAPFGRLSRAFKTPANAILLLGIVGAGLLIAAGFNAVDLLSTGAVFIDGIFFALTGAALFIVRKPADGGFRAPGYPITPALFVIGELGVVAGAYVDPGMRKPAIIGVLWIIGAAVLYWVFFRGPRAVGSSDGPSAAQ